MEWRQIPGFPDYDVSNEGQVRNTKRDLILKSITNKKGYTSVALVNDGKLTQKSVNRLVLETFVGPNGDLQTCHKDGNSDNNHLDNLKWDTVRDNVTVDKKHWKVLVSCKGCTS